MDRLGKKTNSFFYFILDLISFGSPRAIIIDIAIILLLCAAVPISTLESFPVKCLFKSYVIPFVFHGNCPESGLFSGCECPACGMTHALHYLMNGEFRKAWETNRIAFAVIASMASLLASNFIKIAKERIYKKIKKKK